MVISIYRTSTLALSEAMHSLLPAVFHDHVRYVQPIRTHPADLAVSILTAYDATVNLRFSTIHVDGESADVLASLGKLPLQRLSLATTQLFPSRAATNLPTHSLQT